MNPLLKVQHLEVYFKNTYIKNQAVKDISFSILPGEILAIVGESGSGKSVTARALLGLNQGTNSFLSKKSEIHYQEENILAYTKKQWQHYRGKEVGMIFQDSLAALNPTMRIGKQVAEKIMTHSNISYVQSKELALEVIEAVGIKDAISKYDQYPHELSGGMRQRIMIAIALSCNPKLIIADEPTTALDVTLQADIMDLLKEMQKKRNLSLILITHDLGVVADMADRILVMYAGEIIEEGSNKDIFSKATHPYTQALLNAAPKMDYSQDKLETIPGIPPNITEKIKGCPFAPRCQFCMEICVKKSPTIQYHTKTHTSLCWLFHKYSKKE